MKTHLIPYPPVVEQHTPPIQASNPFQLYLDRYKLTWTQVAHAAKVPSLTVWSIAYGMMVSPKQAARVRQGVHTLTLVPYDGPIATIPSECRA